MEDIHSIPLDILRIQVENDKVSDPTNREPSKGPTTSGHMHFYIEENINVCVFMVSCPTFVHTLI